ncbi:MAG TPA: metallophosphoesterase [Candidatus Woesebacteria bacterium]|nr:metallophosphoesterase [Candidatus Woesebacteria bacterium]
MTKILHTADLHLRELDDERWQALELILDQTKKIKADVLTIAGDLLDHDSVSIRFRDQLRQIFSVQPFKIVILPGNHDAHSFPPGSFLGENVHILLQSDDSIAVDNVIIRGLPYQLQQQPSTASAIAALTQNLNKNHTNIVLIHGELTDLFFDSSDYGDEGSKRYYPFSLRAFAGTDVDYLLAGHYHTHSHLKHLPNIRLSKGGYFLYPGSPVSITTKENTPRCIWLIVPDQPPQEIALTSFYYHQLNLNLRPDSTPHVLEEFEQQLKSLPKNAKPLIKVGGYFDQTVLKKNEVELNDTIRQLASRYHAQYSGFEFSAINVDQVVNSSLYHQLVTQINQTIQDQSQQEALVELLIKAMTQP